MARKLNPPRGWLAYQSFGQLIGMEQYQAALEALVRGSTDASADIRVLRLPSAIIEGKGFASAQALEVPELLRSIDAAVRGGAAGIAIGNGFDPGLWEARELFDVPVLGLFETVALYALRVGWRPGVLCSGSSGGPRIEELLARYGIASRFVRPATANVTVPMVAAAFGDEGRATEVMAAARVAAGHLVDRGADVIIVASGILDVFLRAGGADRTLQLPVMPGVPILVRELESSVALAAAGVPSASRIGRFRQPPTSVSEVLRRP